MYKSKHSLLSFILCKYWCIMFKLVCYTSAYNYTSIKIILFYQVFNSYQEFQELALILGSMCSCIIILIIKIILDAVWSFLQSKHYCILVISSTDYVQSCVLNELIKGEPYLQFLVAFNRVSKIVSREPSPNYYSWSKIDKIACIVILYCNCTLYM